MAPHPSDRTGVLVVRLWIESNGADGFRARITRTLDSAGHDQSTSTAATPHDVCAVVRTWVDAFVAANGTDPAPVPLG